MTHSGCCSTAEKSLCARPADHRTLPANPPAQCIRVGIGNRTAQWWYLRMYKRLIDVTQFADEKTDSLDATEPIGWFRRYVVDDAWEWSDEVYRIYGYPPGGRITTPIVLSHRHFRDRERCAATFNSMQGDFSPLSVRHRIVDTNGEDHSVVMVADVLRDVDGSILGARDSTSTSPDRNNRPKNEQPR